MARYFPGGRLHNRNEELSLVHYLPYSVANRYRAGPLTAARLHGNKYYTTNLARHKKKTRGNNQFFVFIPGNAQPSGWQQPNGASAVVKRASLLARYCFR